MGFPNLPGDRFQFHQGRSNFGVFNALRHFAVRPQIDEAMRESLIVMEAPLNKKAQDRIDRFTPTWREAGAFLMQLAGQPVAENAITPTWAPRT